MMDYWVYGLIGLFLVIVVFMTVTPAINDFYAATNMFNFSHSSTNTSLTLLKTYNKNMWDVWPIVAGAIVFIVIFYFAAESGKAEGKY